MPATSSPTLHRFLLVVLPPATLGRQVTAWKATLRARIGGFSSANTLPHITLFFADVPFALGDDVIRAVDEGTAGRRPFQLHYRGLRHFPDKRTIYIDPIEKEAIAAVRSPIVAAARANAMLAEHVRETDHPHLTIAAGLKADQFNSAWALLAREDFHAEQHVNEVVLLQRALVAGSAYAPLRHFPL